MVKYLGLVVLLGVVLLLAGAVPAASVPAAPPPADELVASTPAPQGAIWGVVRDLLTGEPVAGAHVWLRGSQSETRSDREGRYRLPVPLGTWEVAAEAEGYIGMSQVQVPVLSGKTLRIDFDMVLANPDPEQEDLLFHMLVEPPEQGGAQEPATPEVLPASVPSTIRVLMPDGQVVEMDMDEYLKGVVPKEIGIWADMDALKAQAIAARSYAATSWNHAAEGANVCTTTHCQVWGPTHYETTNRAVDETSGMAATYNGRIIRAFYFGHCDGHTRNSEDVWVQALPYLRSVECICGYDYMYGHGVGMCQRGAMAMAAAGATFDEILRHYYTGTGLTGVSPTPTPTPVPSVTPTPTPQPVASVTYRLAKGWNMFSLPVRPDDASVAAILTPIAGKLDLAMQYDAFEPYARWKVYNPVVPAQPALKEIDLRYGVWLRANEACSLTITGRRIITPTEVPLTAGLNFIGYPSLTARPVADALSSITGKYVRLYTYDANAVPSPWQTYDFTVPAEVNQITHLEPGRGYWIEVIQPCILRFDP